MLSSLVYRVFEVVNCFYFVVLYGGCFRVSGFGVIIS